jgi:hypothetical protein
MNNRSIESPSSIWMECSWRSRPSSGTLGGTNCQPACSIALKWDGQITIVSFFVTSMQIMPVEWNRYTNGYIKVFLVSEDSKRLTMTECSRSTKQSLHWMGSRRAELAKLAPCVHRDHFQENPSGSILFMFLMICCLECHLRLSVALTDRITTYLESHWMVTYSSANSGVLLHT